METADPRVARFRKALMKRQTPSDLDKYLFDLNGYIILKGALSDEEIDACNRDLDLLRDLQPGEWHGAVQCHQFSDNNGKNLQQIYEMPAFRPMINHPAWIEYIETFVGGAGSFDYNHGPLFIDEAFGSLRIEGEAIFVHSGGNSNSKRNMYHFKNGEFMCNQVNVLVALTDIGPGDGATVVVPCSHKANLQHPEFYNKTRDRSSAEGITGAIEVYMDKGDALIFTDWISHGSALRRKSDGERRIFVYRYGPSWGFFRHPYRPSKELLAALDDEARNIVWPHDPVLRQPNRLEDASQPEQLCDGKSTRLGGGYG